MKQIAKIYRFLSEDGWLYLSSRRRKPLLHQAREMSALKKRYGFLPYQYVKHKLYSAEFRGDIFDYLPPELVHRYRDSQNPREYWDNVVNKRRFSKIMRDAGLPVVAELYTVERDGVRDLDGGLITYAQFLRAVAGAGGGVFVKPECGGQGTGAHRCELDPAGGLSCDGTSVDEAAFLQLLFGDGQFRRYLVQPLLRQHPEVAALNPGSVNTVRIDTLVLDGKVVNNGAVLRVGSGSSCTDNWKAGGFIVNIHMATGELASDGVQAAKYGGKTVSAHPLTGVPFAGRRIPHWPQVLDVVRHGALALMPLKSLGWDVAIGEDGPMLIEANHDYAIDLLQEGIGGLRQTPIGTQIVGRSHAGGPPPGGKRSPDLAADGYVRSSSQGVRVDK